MVGNLTMDPFPRPWQTLQAPPSQKYKLSHVSSLAIKCATFNLSESLTSQYSSRQEVEFKLKQSAHFVLRRINGHCR